MLCANNKQSEFIFIGDSSALDISTQYGLKCNCTCSECGEPVKAVRKGVKDGKPSWSHFSHASDSACSGSHESDVHRISKFVFEHGIGKTIVLPSTTINDAVPHVSRYSPSGHEERGWKWDYDEYGEPVYLIVEEPREEVLIAVETEKAVDNDYGIKLVPDILATLVDKNGETHQVAFEIRNEHPKSVDDVRKYEKLQLDVVEIYVKNLDISDCESVFGVLKDRLFGYGENMSAADDFREYLYCESVGAIARERELVKRKARREIYKRCERLFDNSVGKTITLPPVGVYNAFIYHNDEYDKEKEPFLFDLHRRTCIIPFSDLTEWRYSESSIPNIEVFPSQEWTIDEVILEECVNDVFFDMALRISRDTQSFVLPVNFEGLTNLSWDDLRKQEAAKQSILEFNFELAVDYAERYDDESLCELLLHGGGLRNWTYNRAARAKADEKFTLWYNFGLARADKGIRKAFGSRQSTVVSKTTGSNVYASYPFPTEQSIVVLNESFRFSMGCPICKCNDGRPWNAQFFTLGVRLVESSPGGTWSIFETDELMRRIGEAIENETGDKTFLLRCGYTNSETISELVLFGGVRR